jgi:glutaredoxin
LFDSQSPRHSRGLYFDQTRLSPTDAKSKVIVMRKSWFLNLLSLLLLITTPPWASPAHSTPRVDIYLTSWCPYCEKAVSFFRERSIPIQIFNIELDQDAARHKRQLDPRQGVPLVVINDQVIFGYSPKTYRTALDE